MVLIKREDYNLEYSDSTDVKEMLFNKMIDFFLKYGVFSGEQMAQSDEAIIAGTELLEEIADEIIKFKVDWI